MILALDIGGTKIAAALVEDGVCRERRQVPMPRTSSEFVEAITLLVKDRPRILAVAAAVTGRLVDGHVRTVNLDTIPFWDGFPLVARLQEIIGAPVIAINDAQAAAWGEYCARGHAYKDLLFVTLSTGVGGGVVLDGGMRIGQHGLAGHIGHSTVYPRAIDAPIGCGCGREGCLESIASGTALARQAKHHYKRLVSSAELFDLAHSGDSEAQSILLNAADAVAHALANAHAQLDLELVVLGGSVGLAPGMQYWIQSAMDRLPNAFRVPIERARLEADAGLIGAAGWVQYLEQKRK